MAEAPHLPDAVVRHIAYLVVAEASPANAVLLTLQLCGVNKQWRALAREVVRPIAFDGTDSPLLPNGALYRFRKQPTAKKAEVYAAAAQLLSGACSRS